MGALPACHQVDESSDTGHEQRPLSPELHKHIYLQFRLNFFSESFINHCEKCVLSATC